VRGLTRSSVKQQQEPRLCSQQERVLDLIVEGHTNREIAEQLGLAEKTVKNYVSAILGKLKLKRRSQAAVYGARLEIGRKRDVNADGPTAES
jgi:two-component system response regulator DevR